MKKFAVIAGIVMLLIVALFFGVTAYVEKRAYDAMTPEMRKSYETWMNKPLTFKKENLEARPFDEETLEAARNYVHLWNEYEDAALDVTASKGQGADRYAYEANVKDPSWPERAEKLKELEDLTRAFTGLVNRPDYKIAVLAEVPRKEGEDPREVPNYLVIQSAAKLLRLEAWEHIREGEHERAFEKAETIIKAGEAEAYSVLISQLIAVAINNIGVNAWRDAVAHCDDPALLRATLERQKAFFPGRIIITRDIPISVSDQLGLIRTYRRRGVDPERDIQGLTGREISGMAMSLRADYNEARLDEIKDVNEKAVIQGMIANDRAMAAAFGAPVENARGLLTKVAVNSFSAMYFKTLHPNFREAATRDDTSLSYGSLLLLDTARKLYRLENGREAESLAELVRAYDLGELPDVFAEDEGAPLKLAEKFAYSLGPDGIDQGGKLKYDPTNGTLSAGDIFQ